MSSLLELMCSGVFTPGFGGFAFDKANKYPPYNIEKIDIENTVLPEYTDYSDSEKERVDGNKIPSNFFYRITMAVAGYKKEEIEVALLDGLITVSGYKKDKPNNKNIVHRGISDRDFKQQFFIDDKFEIGNISLADGILTIDLNRVVVEKIKPKVFSIK